MKRSWIIDFTKTQTINFFLWNKMFFDAKLKKGTKMLFLHNYYKSSQQALEWVIFPGFLTRSDRSCVCTCIPTVVFYYTDIWGKKTFCTLTHGLSVSRLFHLRLSTLEDFDKMMKSNILHILITEFMHKEVQKLRTMMNLLENSGELHQVCIHMNYIEDTLKEYSMTVWESFL